MVVYLFEYSIKNFVIFLLQTCNLDVSRERNRYKLYNLFNVTNVTRKIAGRVIRRHMLYAHEFSHNLSYIRMWKSGKMGQSFFEMSKVRKLSFRDSNYFLMQSLSILKIKEPWNRNPLGIVILFICFCLFALCTFFLYKHHYFIDKTTVNLFFLVNVLICFCKGFDMIVFSISFNRIIIFFEEKMTLFCNNEYIFIKFDKYMKMSNLWTCRIFSLNFFVLSISLVYPLINIYVTQNISLPIGNSYQLTESYAFEFVFQSFGYICSALVSSTFGALYICCCIFITYQLDVLVYEISSLKLNRNYNEYTVRFKLARLIENHVLIIQ